MHTLIKNGRIENGLHASPSKAGKVLWLTVIIASSAPLATANATTLLASATLLALLATLSLIDSRTYRLPNALTVGLILTGGIWGLYNHPQHMPTHILGGLIGYATFWIVANVHHAMTNRHGLGMGDAKLMAGAGLWLGWFAIGGVILLAAIAAILWATLNQKLQKGAALPFGPFLALGIWVSWCHGALMFGAPS